MVIKEDLDGKLYSIADQVILIKDIQIFIK